MASVSARKISGKWGWALTLVGVYLWDVSPNTETMSHWFFPSGLKSRRHMLVLWGYLTLHLLRLIPDRIDPLRKADKRKGY